MLAFAGLIAGVIAIGASDFTEFFDTYASGIKLHSTNGWHGWDNAVAAEGIVSSTVARSGGRSFNTGGSASAVLNFAATSGRWQVKTYQYIPSTATGTYTYIALMNTYVDGGAKNWSTGIAFDLTKNQVYDPLGGASGFANLIRGQWIPVEVQIDLNLKTQDIYYNGVKFATVAWNRLGGVAAFAAINLNAGTISHVYYDDFTVREMSRPVMVSRWRDVTSDE